MRYLLNIYLTGWEWLQDRSGKAATVQEHWKAEKKQLRTFLSQGAVGGAFAYFLVMVGFVMARPSGWNSIYLAALPFMLVFGAALGMFAATFVWLCSVLIGRKPNFIARAFPVVGSLTLLGFVSSYLKADTPLTNLPTSWGVGIAGSVYLLIVLMTGSKIRPGHLLFLGGGVPIVRGGLGSWLAFSAGVFLRALSIFGLLEALMFLALWISSRLVGWVEFFPPEDLPPTIVAVLYFVFSSLLSIRTPSKFALLPLAILLNLPLVGLISYLIQLGSTDSYFLSGLLMSVLGLWAIYTLGRLIATEATLSVSEPWNAHVKVQSVVPSRHYQVVL